MPNLNPHPGPTKLVLALDVGTTFSGISYCILEPGQVPDVLGVTKFPAQPPGGDAKVPSLLYYDKSGNAQAAGAEVLAEGVIETALQEEWTKAEWWKLHLRPKHLAATINKERDLPPLPSGKTAVDILTDFVKYLFQCAKAFITQRHLAFPWSSVENSIEYIFTHPNGWDGVQQQLYRLAVARAGLVPPTLEGQIRVHLLTEAEASLHFCVADLLSKEITNQVTPQGVVVIDAGDQTINLNMFKMTTNPFSCEEIAPAECRLQGSAFVTRRAKALLQSKLEGWEHSTPAEIDEFTREFDQTTKLVIKSDEETAYVRVAGRRYNNAKYNISFGKLKLTGKEATGLFSESFEAIAAALERQQKSAKIPITMAFLVGDLSTNDWLWSQLQSYFKYMNVDICRPDNHINKVVANGAVFSHLTSKEPVIQLNNAAILPSSRLHPTLQEPDIEIDEAALESWKHDQLEDVDQLLTAAITASQNPNSHVVASRALIRARLRLWDAALQDADKAINIKPSVIAFIAKSVAHIGKGDWDKAYRACDIAFEYHHLSHVSFILLIKAIIVFMAGDHPDALSRVDDLIATGRFNDVCHTVQAYMHFLLGNLQMESNDWVNAIQSFEHAQARMRDYAGPPLLAISLTFGWKFDDFSMTVRRRLCEALYASGRTEDAVKCFRQLKTEPSGHGEDLEWALDFRQRSYKRLESLGDAAADAQRYNDAISYYSTALSLISLSPEAIIIKRCGVLLKKGFWRHALEDANKLIALDSSSPWAYEPKHAALHYGGDYDNAIKAFEMMLSRMTESCDPDVQQQANKYISPSETRAAIRKTVQRTLRRLPYVLVNTTTGRLHSRAEQASAFESLPIFKELISSMTTHIDHPRIKEEVRQYYRYVVLSHKWEDNEPSFQHMVHVAVYDLEASPTHDKLQTFCKITLDSGFHWAWSDTCCIDKTDISMLQESLVSMFRWYQNSSMMIVFLRGVSPSSPRGALAGSIWNTRAWTLQEYIAAKVVRFYTQDWTLYHDLDVPNHKECPEIMAEMEEVTRISAQQLMVLRPGLGNIREKLCLASTRETTRVEDAAHSLLGIFSAIGVPVIYGEREASLGRLIANVITRSGDASSLAWVGDCSAFNSCLPARIAVFNEPATSHLPSPVPDSEMEAMVAGMHTPSFDLDMALKLYDRLNELVTPRFAESRMTLPCIAFKLPSFVAYRAGAGRVYRAETLAFGTVDIRTRQDLTGMKPLYLVHPWLDSLLAHQDMHGGALEDDDGPPSSPISDDEEVYDDGMYDRLSLLPESPSRRSIVIEPVSRETEARRLVTRLGRPFGALVLRAVATGRRRGAVDYKRVATDALVTVQFREDISLGDVLANVRVLDVL